MKYKRLAVLLLSVSAVCGLLFLTGKMSRWLDEETAGIRLNEVCAHNTTTLKQKFYGSCDYIEIYNAGDSVVSLEGYGLSDERGAEAKFTFEGGELPPGGYLIVFAAGEVPDVPEKIFANFKISDGDTIYLTNPDGEIIDYVEMIPTIPDVVYARAEDGVGEWTTRRGSPWADNATVREVVIPTDLDAPVFSAESGFYKDSFTLEMEAGESRIYYTLDGSIPNESSMLYEEPILLEDASGRENVWRSRTDFAAQSYDIPEEKVDKAVIVRAVAVNAAGETSRATTATYFVGERFFEKYQNWSVVSIVADPEDLFGDDGIYVLGRTYEQYLDALEAGEEEKEVIPANYLRHGSSMEREAKVEIFDGNRERRLSQEVGLNLNGNGSRASEQKSFRIVAREKYDGTNEIRYDGFYQNRLPDSMLIRRLFSQNQWLTTLVEDRAPAVQRYEPCVLFLDGEYWGIYSIQERCTEEYIENHFGVPAEQVILVKGGALSLNEWDEKYNAYEQIYAEFDADIARWHDSGVDCYAEIAEKVDIQSYIDYLCIQTYIGNCDFRDKVNVAFWRTEAVGEGEYADGKWRYILFDLDRTLEDVKRDSFMESMFNDPYSVGTDPLFMTLLRSEVFRKQFVNTFMEIAVENLSYENVMEKLRPLEKKYQTEIITPYEEYFKNRAVYAFESLERQFPAEYKNGDLDGGKVDTKEESVESEKME